MGHHPWTPPGDPAHGILGASLASDGGAYGLIQIPAGGSNLPFSENTAIADTCMTIRDGREVFVRAVEMMQTCSNEALVAAGLSAVDIDRFIPHQANVRIVNAVGNTLGIEDARIVNTIADHGNSSAATIPLSLSIAHGANPFRSNEKLLLAAAGAGLCGGALVIGL